VLGCTLVAEGELRPADEATIRELLLLAFPQFRDIFSTRSYFGACPDHRLMLRGSNGELLAHLTIARRVIDVGAIEILIAGVGGVAVRPERQGEGLGQKLMEQLGSVLRNEVPAPFAYLNCREEVAGFYQRAGWQRLDQVSRFLDPYTNRWIDYTGPKLILAGKEPAASWPREGKILLRGMPW
jgi:GNAT superfamily N-acetyltransferase